ncbi:hypothetical protein NEFER03_0867 [Nematocida sp. LUAm3]|nr:hypothetical protein NEFER03_0867 [Nematocida sp. LUAm3]KAI5174885.1 hypothetical protein NEFER02_0985 [Nematocida sp. LUAm2]KAI5177517.1 hypothetical protein NEFER01_0767 [Nematocida sp. LUAm1]
MHTQREYVYFAEEIQEGNLTFSEICKQLICTEHDTNIHVLEGIFRILNIIYHKQVVERFFSESSIEPQSSQTSSKEMILPNYLWKYVLRIEKIYDVYFPIVNEFLAIYTNTTRDILQKENNILIEKKLIRYQEIIESLENRTKAEKEMGYIPSFVLDTFLEIARCDEEEHYESLLHSISKIKEMNVFIKDTANAKKSLSSFFFDLVEIINRFSFFGNIHVVSLYKICEEISIKETSSNMGVYPESISLFASLLMFEIKTWATSLFSPVQMYFDPNAPRLAGSLVIRSASIFSATPNRRNLHMCKKRIFSLVLRHIHYPMAQINAVSFYIEPGIQNIHISSWEIFSRIFRLDIIILKIKISPKSTIEDSMVLNSFLSSKIASGISHLVFLSMGAIDSSAIRLLGTFLILESFTIMDPNIDVGFQENVGTFIQKILLVNQSFFDNTKYLVMSFPYSQKVFDIISSMQFISAIKFEMELLLDKQQRMDPEESRSISQILNRTVFPRLKEASVHDVISQYELEKVCIQMDMVQTRYNRFYCPLGASYIIQRTYTFKNPETFPMNIGLVFLISEKFIGECLKIPRIHMPRMCMLCDKMYDKYSEDILAILPCGNVFHISCISQTFSSKKNPNCPLCKKRIHISHGLAVAINTLFIDRIQTPPLHEAISNAFIPAKKEYPAHSFTQSDYSL